jgi:RND family efflux transporter MFP subunit
MNSTVRNTTVFGIALTMTLVSCSHEGNQAVQDQPAVEVTLSNPVRDGAQTIRVSGQLASSETAIISTRIMGYINNIYVAPGDKVAKGQLLLSISNADILARKAQARAIMTEAEAALRDARKDLERYTQLYQQQSASAKELENVTLQYQSLEAKAEAAKQMMQEAEATLAYTQIKAPFTGTVTRKNADEGSMANPGMPLLILEQTDSYTVNTSVSEQEIGLVRPGASAVVTIKSNDRSFSGTVTEVSPSSSMSGGRYDVRISVPTNEREGLYAGMYASVDIVATGSLATTPTLLVPSSALVEKDQLVGLYTVSESQTALLRWVKTGRTYDDHVEVLSGLNENERFIMSANGKLYNGAPVLTQ